MLVITAWALGHEDMRYFLWNRRIYFMAKLGKMWQYTIMTVLVGVLTYGCLIYIPWYIASIGMAIIADFIASRKGNEVSTCRVISHLEFYT